MGSDQPWRDPKTISASGRKLILVYRQTWIGRKLAGWVDENGHTFKSNWPSKPILLYWSVDEQGHIYIGSDEYRALVGWLEEDGDVYAQYGHPSSGFFSYPENIRLIKPPVEFSPALIFQVKADGTVYHQDRRGDKTIGKIEGTTNLNTIAGLALVVLL